MPQSLQNKEYRTFVKGLITDASPLSFPEDASLDEDNYEININGFRQRRLGLDYEGSAESYSEEEVIEEDLIKGAISVHYWKNPSNRTNIELVALQYANQLIVIEANSTPMVFLLQKEMVGSDPNYIWQSTIVNGDLLLATGDFCVHRVTYNDSVGAVLDIEKHGLLVRDIWGVDDGFSDSETFTWPSQNSTMGDKRLYNLMNQGWSARATGTTIYPMVYPWLANTGYWPSNLFTPSTAWTVTPPFPDDTVIFPNSQDETAPKGHYILDFFYRGQSRRVVSSGNSLLDNLYTEYPWGQGFSGSLKYILRELTTEAYLNLVNLTEGSGFTSVIAPSVGTSDLLYDGVNSSVKEGGVGAIASYASRVFYSGFKAEISGTDTRSLQLGNVILFSQVVSVPDNIGKCYQEGDPTSASELDLVDSDGGLIVIPGMGTVRKMISLGEYLVVFSNNGIWAISGGESAFSATNFIVNKVSDTICVSPQSIVIADDTLYFWSENGIYKLYADKSSEALLLQSITERKISSLYRSFSDYTKTYCQGVYDSKNRTIRWLYNDTSSYDGTDWRFRYNRQLNFNMDLQSFYPFSFNSIEQETGEAPFIAGLFSPPSFNISEGTDNVTSNGELVFAPTAVTTTVRVSTANLPSTKYISVQGDPAGGTSFIIRMCELNNADFLDWYTSDSTGVDSPAYLETGYELLGDTQREKQIVYLTTHFKRTETGFDELNDYAAEGQSSCLVSAYWGFANHSNSGKISTPFQAYRLSRWYIPADSSDPFNYGQSVVTTKNKVRGRGKALSLKFETEAGKDCIIYGWGILFSANVSP